LREAVGSGSAFVAPKRIREIINRWASSGTGPRRAGLERGAEATAIRQAGDDADETLNAVKQTLDETLEINAQVEFDGASVLLRLDSASPEIKPDAIAALEHRLAEALGRDVHVRSERPSAAPSQGRADEAEAAVRVSRRDVQQGEQLWSVLLDMLAPEVAPADLFRLRSVVPIGESADGAFLLGAPTRLAARLLEGRYLGPLESALSSLLSSPVRIRVLNQDQWSIVD
jgi:hypothetical protein